MTSIDDFTDDDWCEVTPQWLRDLFHELNMIHKALIGELRPELIRENHPSPTNSGEPVCTWSQRLRYVDRDGNQVAQVHQYLQPSGAIGASGMPDPKLILHEGTVYAAI